MRGKQEIRKIRKYQKRFMQYARSNYETAEILYNAGNTDFVKEAVNAGRYYGAAEALEMALNNQEGEKVRERTEREMQLIYGGIIQRIMGIIFLISSAIMAANLDGDMTGLLLFIPLGIYLILTKRNLIKI